MTDIQSLVHDLVQFRDERDWEQFHNAKDLAIAINVESGELLELFLWKSPDEVDPGKIKEELADIFCFALLLGNKYGFNIEEIIKDKIKQNSIKYPINKAKGTARKYNEL